MTSGFGELVIGEAGREQTGRLIVVAGLGAAIALGAISIAIQGGGRVSLGPSLVLFALAVLAAQRETVFADETAVSGSVIVVIAAIVGTGAESAVVPLVCSVGAVLHLAHLRDMDVLKVLVNIGGVTGPAFVATGVFQITSVGGFLALPSAIVASVGIYWLLNNAFVGFGVAFIQGQNGKSFAWELARSETIMLVFAVGGALCGLVMVEVDEWIGIGALVALLVALDVFVVSVPSGPATLRAAWKMLASRVAGATVSGIASATAATLVSSVVIGALLGVSAGLAGGLATIMLIGLVRMRAAGSRIHGSVMLGFVLAEVALPGIGAVAGTVGALAGLGAAVATASGLVIAASLLAALRRGGMHSEHLDDETLLAVVTEALFDGLPHPSHRT